MKLETVLDKEPRMVRRIKALCNRLTDGTVMCSKAVCRKLGVAAIDAHSAHPSLAKYRFMVARTTWWGSLKTIKEARKMQK